MQDGTNNVFVNPIACFGYGIYPEFVSYLESQGIYYSYHYIYKILNGDKRSRGLTIEKAAIRFARVKKAEYEEAQAILAQAL